MLKKFTIVLLFGFILAAMGTTKPIFTSYDYSNRIITNGDLLTQILHQSWMNNVWTDISRQSYTYPSDNQRVEIQQMWDNSAWINTTRFTVTYDDHMNMVEMIVESAITETWFQTMRNVFNNTYDPNGNLIEVISQTEMFGTMTNSSKTTHTYDNGKLIESIDQTWENGNWVNDSKTVITYNNGNKADALIQIWENEAWVNSQNITYTHDNGNLTETMAQQWENGAWVNTVKTDHAYSGGKLSEELIQHWSSGTWVDANKNIYTWGGSTGVEDGDTQRPLKWFLTNYPNPFNPQTTIHLTLEKSDAVVLKIYDINGKLVKSLLNRETFSAGSHTVIWNGTDQHGRSLPSGVYFYRIEAGSFKQTRRCTLVK